MWSISRRRSVRSGLVDLVVGVGCHVGGGHRLAFAGERFVGLVAEDIAEVSDRGIEFGDRQCGEGLSAKPASATAIITTQLSIGAKPTETTRSPWAADNYESSLPAGR